MQKITLHDLLSQKGSQQTTLKSPKKIAVDQSNRGLDGNVLKRTLTIHPGR